MSSNLLKRIFTSILLFILLLISFFFHKYSYLVLIIIASIISFLEFKNLSKKIWKTKKNYKNLANIICFFYLIFFTLTAYKLGIIREKIIFVILICILSDVGGYIVGKLVGGKKLTRISPNKTISGSIGSFFFSTIILIIYSANYHKLNIDSIFVLLLIALILSSICQLGDLVISYLKRRAKVKDTGWILPGHGGLLDRIDGIIFAIPSFFLIDKVFF